jgi:endonuclease YncB( thermonuclease family)
MNRGKDTLTQHKARRRGGEGARQTMEVNVFRRGVVVRPASSDEGGTRVGMVARPGEEEALAQGNAAGLERTSSVADAKAPSAEENRRSTQGEERGRWLTCS